MLWCAYNILLIYSLYYCYALIGVIPDKTAKYQTMQTGNRIANSLAGLVG